MRVRVFMTDDTIHDFHNCEECYSPSSNVSYVRIVTKDRKYIFNMHFVKYVELFEEE